MIRKLLKVRNVGKLAKGGCSHEFRKLTLVYGENAGGKSTLAAILRSLGEGDGAELQERRTLDGDGVPSLEILVGTGTHVFDGNVWDRTCPQIHVYDATFIDRNVYSGFDVTPSHRERLMSFALGEDSVKLQREMQEQADEIQALNTPIREKEADLKVHAGGPDLKTFLNLPKIDDAAEKISTIRAELKAIEDSGTIAKRLKPSKLSEAIPIDEYTISQLLKEGVPELAEGAVRLVEDHAKQLKSPEGKPWLQQGTAMMADDECPYCGQDTSQVELIKAMQAYFGKSYANLKARIAEAKQAFENAGRPERMASLKQAIAKNLDIAATWPELPRAHTSLEAAGNNLEKLLERKCVELRRILTSKVTEPLGALTLSGEAKEDLAHLTIIHSAVQTYNNAIDQLVADADGFVEKAKAGNPLPLKAELDRVQKSVVRHSEAVSKLVVEYQAAKKAKEKLDTEKAITREQLESTANATLKGLANKINAFLEKFGADFRLVAPVYSQAGGTPKAHWKLNLREKVVDPGSQGGGPTFRTVLSDGDRRTLALALFLAKLHDEPALANAYVVFDDPMSSFDDARRKQTREAIACLFLGSAQVIVCSHERHFLLQVRKAVSHASRQVGNPLEESHWTALRFRRSGKCDAVLDEMNLDRECLSDFERRYLQVDEYLHEGTGEPRSIVVELRPMLESFLKRRFLVQLIGTETLGKMLEQTRVSIPAWADSAEGKRWSKLNDDLCPFHHDTDAEQHLGDLKDAAARLLATEAVSLIRGMPVAAVIAEVGIPLAPGS